MASMIIIIIFRYLHNNNPNNYIANAASTGRCYRPMFSQVFLWTSFIIWPIV